MQTLMRLVIISIYFILSACSTKFNLVHLPGADGLENGISLPPQQTYVCDPFDSGRKSTDHTGILGQLHYLDSTQPRYSLVNEYLQNGHLLDEIILVINRLFVPTRPFDRGFVTLGGDVLRDENGATLTEWFAVNMQTRIGLGPTDVAGDYQLAFISDDGATLSYEGAGGTVDLLNNDGYHSSQMKCATQPLHLNSGDRLPASIKYFQGPRTQIALILMWRPWPNNPNAVQDPQCDLGGNNYFFDPTQNPSAPTSHYNDLLTRGWRPMSADNFYLPDGVLNPCD